MIRINLLFFISLLIALNTQAKVGCKEVTQTFYSESLFFRVESNVTFCYCSEEEGKDIRNRLQPIQPKLDEIKKRINLNLKKYKNDFYATFHACNEYVDEKKKTQPYQHEFPLDINEIKIEGFTVFTTVKMCFYKEVDQKTLQKIENKIIKR